MRRKVKHLMMYKTLSDFAATDGNIFQASDGALMTRLFSTNQNRMTSELVMMWGSVLVNLPVTGNDNTDLSRLRALTSTVFYMYIDKYTKMQALFSIEYAPLENYNMTESGSEDSSGTNESTTNATDNGTATEVRDLATSYTSTGQDSTTGSNTITYNTTDTTTHNTTDTTTYGHTVATTGNTSNTLNNTTTDTVAPFDSETFFNNTQTTGANTSTGTDTSNVTNSGQDSTKATGTDTTAHTGTEGTSSSNTTDTTKTDSGTNTGSVETTNSTQSSTLYSGNTTENTTHTLTRRGNIGVTTAQQMLESELELIPKKQIKFEFYNDLKRLILIGLYF